MDIAPFITRAAEAKAVVFDFGGVISVSPMDRWDETLYPFCAAHGLSKAGVLEGFRRFRKLWDGDDITFEEMYRRVFAAAGAPAPSDDTLAEIRRLDAGGWVAELRDDTLELMRTLKAAGKTIGILSNMSSDFHRDYFAPRCAAYRALAEVEVISGFERLCKPDPRLYAIAEARIGRLPREILFFDDFAENVAAARACGWQAELYPARDA